MKYRLAGLVIILIGFTVPFALKRILPTFLNALFISQFCFWVGFIAILSPVRIYSQHKPYLRWARYAVLTNIMLNVLAVTYFYLFLYLDLQHTLGVFFVRVLSFLSNPIEWIFDLLMPKPMVQQPDGSVVITTSFIRALLTDFLNLMFFCLLGIFTKYIIRKKITNACSRPR
jgi:hypothetical protein